MVGLLASLYHLFSDRKGGDLYGVCLHNYFYDCFHNSH